MLTNITNKLFTTQVIRNTVNLLYRNIYLLTEFNCVDNSELGEVTKRYRKPYLIGFYRKRRTVDVGDVIKVAVKGRPCRALVVGARKEIRDFAPRFDRNNIILLDDNNAPMGSKVKVPVPCFIRRNKVRYPKVFQACKKYV